MNIFKTKRPLQSFYIVFFNKKETFTYGLDLDFNNQIKSYLMG